MKKSLSNVAVKALAGLMADTAAEAAAETLGDKLSDVHSEALIARWLKNFQTLRPTKLITHWAINGQRR